eukprot:gene2965-12972_t
MKVDVSAERYLPRHRGGGPFEFDPISEESIALLFSFYLVNVSVTHGKERVVVKIAYKTGRLWHANKGNKPPPAAHWGVFRGTPDKSYHPKESIPPDSLVDEGSGGMRSPTNWETKSLRRMRVWKQYDSPVHGLSHVVPLGMSPGQAKPLGSSVSVQQGLPVTEGRHNVNFAVFSIDAVSMTLCLVFSRDAVSMTLCLVRIEPAVSSASNAKGLTYMEIALDPHTNKTGDLWHTCVHGLKDIGTLTYGWKLMWSGCYFLECVERRGYKAMDIDTLMYGWKADGAAAWNGGGKFHGGYLLLDPYATQAVSLVLPETYWKVANKLPPSPKHDLPVLLGSLAPLAPQKKLPGPPLTGRSNRPPNAKSRRRCVIVIRSGCAKPSATGHLSSDLSAPGMVLLQLELCTTGEGADGVGQSGLQGLHGLGGDVYYRRSPDGIEVLRVGHPVVRQLVMDALHFWAKEYCVDGFCILKAENLAQDREGLIMDNPALPEEIAHDPVLKRLQLIVVPSNPSLLPRNGERGFPHWGVWAQWNPSFAFDMHNYVVNNKSGLMSKLATIITGLGVALDLLLPNRVGTKDWQGSPDLLSARWDGGLPGALATGRPPSHAMNTVAPLGSTAALPALLALERGVPGGGPPKPNSPPPQWNDVLARTLLLSMFTSLGTPCFSAATVVSDPALRRFVGVLGVLRQSLAELLAPPFHDSPRQLRWHGAKTDSQPDWTGKSSTPHANCIAFSVRNDNGRAVYVALNPYNEKVYMALPVPPDGMAWKCVINTGGPPPGDAIVPTDEGLPSLATQPLNNSRQQVVLEPLAGALVMAIGRPSLDFDRGLPLLGSQPQNNSRQQVVMVLLATQPLNNSRQQMVLEPLAGALVMAIGRPS